MGLAWLPLGGVCVPMLSPSTPPPRPRQPACRPRGLRQCRHGSHRNPRPHVSKRSQRHAPQWPYLSASTPGPPDGVGSGWARASCQVVLSEQRPARGCRSGTPRRRARRGAQRPRQPRQRRVHHGGLGDGRRRGGHVVRHRPQSSAHRRGRRCQRLRGDHPTPTPPRRRWCMWQLWRPGVQCRRHARLHRRQRAHHGVEPAHRCVGAGGPHQGADGGESGEVAQQGRRAPTAEASTSASAPVSPKATCMPARGARLPPRAPADRRSVPSAASALAPTAASACSGGRDGAHRVVSAAQMSAMATEAADDDSAAVATAPRTAGGRCRQLEAQLRRADTVEARSGGITKSRASRAATGVGGYRRRGAAPPPGSVAAREVAASTTSAAVSATVTATNAPARARRVRRKPPRSGTGGPAARAGWSVPQPTPPRPAGP